MAIRLVHTLLLAQSIILLCACQTTPNYHLIYPQVVPTGVTTWQQDITEDGLQIHFSWAKPIGKGPFPTVMVHPHGGKTTDEMEGVILDLAKRGFLAVAVDYKRLLDGKYQRTTFVWKSEADITRSLEIIRHSQWVDPDRIAALGFSQGGMFSLIIAANAPNKLKTVIAYYPVADFNDWLNNPRGFFEGIAYNFIRAYFYDESRASSEQQFQQILKKASPMTYANQINVPVLLIHGSADTTAPVDQSEKLYAKLKALHKDVKLIIVPGAVHIFNFRQQQQSKFAWEKTILWLKQHLETDE